MKKRLTIAIGLLALALGLAACGDDSGDGGTTTAAGAADASETVGGTFESVPDAPKGSDELAGTAEMTVGDAGTEVSIELSGLAPDTEYINHMHAGGCDQPDPGGPHFMFDLNGEETPPNEIHLPFTSDGSGDGAADASNDQAVPDPSSRSVVVHLAEDDAMSGDSDGMKDEGMGHSDEKGSGEKAHSEHGEGDGHTGHSHAPTWPAPTSPESAGKSRCAGLRTGIGAPVAARRAGSGAPPNIVSGVEQRTLEWFELLARALIWAAGVVLVLSVIGAIAIAGSDSSLPFFEDLQRQGRAVGAVGALGGGVAAAGVLSGLGAILRLMLDDRAERERSRAPAIGDGEPRG